MSSSIDLGIRRHLLALGVYMAHFARRFTIKMGLGLFGALPHILPLLAHAAKDLPDGKSLPSGSLNWDAFTDEISRLAEEEGLAAQALRAESAGIEYARAVGRALKKLRRSAIPAPEQVLRRVGSPDSAILHKSLNFEVALFRFERGESIPLHDHPGMIGVSLCSTGEMSVENYELRSSTQNHERVVLERTKTDHLTEGLVSALTPTSHNIHRLHANRPCELIDIFTPPYDVSRARDTKWYKLVEPHRARSTAFWAVSQ